MSEQNVEIVRSVFEAFGKHDEVTPFKHHAPEIEWEDRVSGVVEVHHGHGGTRVVDYLDHAEALKAVGLQE